MLSENKTKSNNIGNSKEMKMSRKSKRRSISKQFVMIVIGVFGLMSYILAKNWKLSSGTVKNRDQYYMPSYWGSHECSAKSSPCKDIPDYFKGMIPILNKFPTIMLTS